MTVRPLVTLAGLGCAISVALLGGCTGDTPLSAATVTATVSAPPAPSVTAAPDTPRASSPTAAAAAPSPTVSLAGPVDVQRVLQHLRTLAGDIGTRAAGTEGERKAAQYIAGVLRSQGYATTVEPFTFRMRYDESAVKLADGTTLEAALLEGAAAGTAAGPLVVGGSGTPQEIPAEARGAVLLLRRGGITFGQKVANAQAAGAVGVVIANAEPGAFRGTLGDQRAGIPAVAVEGRDWDPLRLAAGQTVTVSAQGGMRTVTSQNVVGRKGATCRAYIGAHYDSVPAGPGANDNASGTATVLELARVRGVDGLCVVAFGSEEVGLRGSQAFVAEHLAGGARFMLNFDMTGRVDGAMIIGDQALTQSILGIIGRGPDQPLAPGAFPPYASSDHVSFSAVGVPAVTITSGDDPNLHRPTDTVEAVREADLRTMLTHADAALGGLLRTLGGR